MQRPERHRSLPRGLQTGDWEGGIPQLCLGAIGELCNGLEDDGLIRERLEAGKLWDLLRRYYQEVQEHGSADSQAAADNYFVRLGIIGGHFEDVVPAFQKLLAKGKGPDWEVFHDLHYLLLCRELVQAHTGKLPADSMGHYRDQALSRVAVALAAGDLDQADKSLARIGQQNEAGSRLAARYRRALGLGRKLMKQGSLSLAPQDVKDVCTDTEMADVWRVEGDTLTAKLSDRSGGELVFPVGLKHAVITGTLEWSGPVSQVQLQAHTRALRHTVRLTYYPEQQTVQLGRQRSQLTEAPYKPGPQRFRLDFGGETDRLEPCPEVQWEDRVSADLPSGFGLVFYGTPGTTMALRDLRIELKE